LAPEVIVRIVPAATVLPAVAEFEDPAVAAVEKLSIELPAVQVVEAVDAVTLNNVHVVLAPEYE
jgi:hypothetical protein